MELDKLQELAIFGGLNVDTLNTIVSKSSTVVLSVGEFFFREEDFADCMYVLLAGKVEVTRAWKERDYVLQTLYSGDSFGEMAIMDFSTRSASVKVLEPCSAMCIDIGCFNDVRELDLEQFTLLQMNMGRQICRRLRVTDELLFQAIIKRSSVS